MNNTTTDYEKNELSKRGESTVTDLRWKMQIRNLQNKVEIN
jgi:hypothetical protein